MREGVEPGQRSADGLRVHRTPHWGCAEAAWAPLDWCMRAPATGCAPVCAQAAWAPRVQMHMCASGTGCARVCATALTLPRSLIETCFRLLDAAPPAAGRGLQGSGGYENLLLSSDSKKQPAVTGQRGPAASGARCWAGGWHHTRAPGRRHACPPQMPHIAPGRGTCDEQGDNELEHHLMFVCDPWRAARSMFGPSAPINRNADADTRIKTACGVHKR